MKVKYTLFFTLFLAFVLISCKNGNRENEGIIDSTAVDSINSNAVLMDTTNLDTLKAGHKVFKNKDVEEAHKVIVKKYGVQWDFCKCIEKNDSINKALMNDDLTEAESDKLLKRLDEVGVKCKDMLIQPNSTPEERAAYQERVRKCLNKK